MSEANKQVVRRVYDEVFGQGKLEVVDEVIAADAVEHTPPSPDFPLDDVRRGLKEFVQMMRQGLPDLRLNVEHMVAEGDLVAVNVVIEGTHQGELMGVPPSDAQVSVRGFDLIRVVDGMCTEHWGVQEDLKLLQQIGAMPAG
jgi:predicted ester cyclase